MADSSYVTGLFRDRDSAERAYQSLTDRGYSKDDVNLVMSDETPKAPLFQRRRWVPSSGPKQPKARGSAAPSAERSARSLPPLPRSERRSRSPGSAWSSPDRWQRPWQEPGQEQPAAA